jgi:hypothetical protein
MRIHDLKIDPQPFADLVSGAKTGEVRNDDRGFEVGDTVRFPGGHCCTISHIQRGYGLPDGLCVLSYAHTTDAPEQEPVAWLVGKTLWENRSAAIRDAADRMRLVRPLYTHADDGELERLRDENESLLRKLRGKHALTGATYDLLIKERDRLRNQLAEAQALLRKALTAIRFVGKQDHLVDYALTGNIQAEVEQYVHSLSATTQPADGVKSDD